jgi:hypothetical protein
MGFRHDEIKKPPKGGFFVLDVLLHIRFQF